MQVAEEALREKPRLSPKLIELIPGAAITAAISLLFFSLYWNRFAGLRSGNGSFQGGMALLRGILPYRDYFTAGPPLNQLISAAVLELFGQKLIVIRGWGVFERVAIALLLFFWLARFFRPSHAAMASIAAIIISAGDPSNALSSYAFEAIFFFMLSGFLVSWGAERDRLFRWFVISALLAGFCAALSLASKQTLGMGATTGIPLLGAIFLWRMSGARKALVFLACFAAGWSLGAGLLLLWLASAGTVGDFLQDVFRKGPSAKASHPSDFVIRAARAAWGVRWGFAAACAALAVYWPALRREYPGDRDPAASGKHELSHLVSVALLGAGSIALGTAAAYAGFWPLKGVAGFAIYFGFLGTVLLLLHYVRRLFLGNLSEREAQICFLAGISFGIAFMVSLSWPASFDMVFPAFGLMIAAALHGSSGGFRNFVYAACALAILGMTAEKLTRPHGFHEWNDGPVNRANTPSALPALQGILLPKTTARFLDETVRIAREHATPQSTIFVYPEFGILYTLAERRYPTATDSHNIDVVNDTFAVEEAQRLLASRPAVLVYFRTPEWSLRTDEKLWRNGHRSGQRDIIAAVEKLVQSYHLQASFKMPPNSSPVEVYVRE